MATPQDLVALVRIFNRVWHWRQIPFSRPLEDEEMELPEEDRPEAGPHPSISRKGKTRPHHRVQARLSTAGPPEVVGLDSVPTTEAQRREVAMERLEAAKDRIAYDLAIQQDLEPWSSREPWQRNERIARQLRQATTSHSVRDWVRTEEPVNPRVPARMRETFRTATWLKDDVVLHRPIWAPEPILVMVPESAIDGFINSCRTGLFPLTEVGILPPKTPSGQGFRFGSCGTLSLPHHGSGIELVGFLPAACFHATRSKKGPATLELIKDLPPHGFPQNQILEAFRSALAPKADSWTPSDKESQPLVLPPRYWAPTWLWGSWLPKAAIYRSE